MGADAKIILRPAIGPPVEAEPVSIALSVENVEILPYITTHVAVVEGLHEQALITPKVYRALKEQREKYLDVEAGGRR